VIGDVVAGVRAELLSVKVPDELRHHDFGDYFSNCIL
jgi:hypothetical protein